METKRESGFEFTRYGGRSEERGTFSSSVSRAEKGSHQSEASADFAFAIGGELQKPWKNSNKKQRNLLLMRIVSSEV